MEIRLGFLANENLLQIMTLDTESHELTREKADLAQLPKFELNMLVYNQELTHLDQKIGEQNKFLPVTTFDQLATQTSPEELEYDGLLNLYHSVADRWVIRNNLNTIENMVAVTTYLKGLWAKDRHSFFEELWYLFKTNCKCSELNIIFHDLQENQEALCYSQVKGTKLPNIQPGTSAEEALMKDYTNDFNQVFNITEYSAEKRQLVACAKIDLSPILFMARVDQFTALQEALIHGVLKGLQKPSDQN